MTKSKFLKQFEKAFKNKDWNLIDTLLSEDLVNQLEYVEKEKVAEFFFEKGEALLNSSDDLDVCLEAYTAFEQSLRLDVSLAKSWIKFAKAHLKLGILKNESALIFKASELFNQAELLYKSRGQKFPLDGLWDFGSCLYWIAKESEEACDFKLALDKYQEAYESGLEEGAFLLDYGTAMGELGVIVGKPELILEATSYLERSIQLDGDTFAWLRLASAYKMLYFLCGDLGYFEKADQSFVAAARANADEFDLWANWGHLLLHEGKLTQDVELITAALEKFTCADQKMPNQLSIMTAIGDSLTHLGIIEERLDYFKEAKEKLEQAEELAWGNKEVLLHLGHCFAHMGKYLTETKYLHQAIEKFQMGISQDKNAYLFWHGLAMTYFMLAEITQEPLLFEKTAKFCIHAINLGGDVPDYWNDAGVALMKLGELSGETQFIASAVEKFEGAIQSFNRKSTGMPDPDWFYNYGCALDWLGDFELNPHHFERAVAILSHVHEQYPHLHHVRYNLALALYHLGDSLGEVEPIERSIEHFFAFIKEEPEDDGAISDLGLAFLTLGDLLQEAITNQRSLDAFNSAQKYLTHSIALGNTRSNYYLACLHALKKQAAEAMYFLERTKAQGVLPTLNDILEDEWLDPIRQTEEFKSFIQRLGFP